MDVTRAIAAVATAVLMGSCTVGSPGQNQSGPSGTTGHGAACTPTRGDHGDGSPGAGPLALGQVTLGPGMSVSRSAETMARTAGRAVRISGVVYDRQCRPLSGAAIQLWQTNAEGEYGPGHGTDQMRCCYLQGAVQTDAAGRYQVDTIMPGHYKGAPDPPPAHIHVWVSHPSAPSLSTELDVAGDPDLPQDASPLVTLREEAGVLMGRFDIVLTGR